MTASLSTGWRCVRTWELRGGARNVRDAQVNKQGLLQTIIVAFHWLKLSVMVTPSLVRMVSNGNHFKLQLVLEAAGPVNLEEGCFDKDQSSHALSAARHCCWLEWSEETSRVRGSHRRSGLRGWIQYFIQFHSPFDHNPVPLQAGLQNRQHVKRFMDSLLRLSTKLKSLRRDIRDNYKVESTDQP